MLYNIGRKQKVKDDHAHSRAAQYGKQKDASGHTHIAHYCGNGRDKCEA
jgi:hypothetical protein